MSLYRYQVLNGDGLMLMKRWFGTFWRPFKNFDNDIREKEHKLEGLWQEMITVKAERDALVRQKKEIIKSVEAATGKPKGHGEPFSGKSFTGFRKPDVDQPPQNWKAAFTAAKEKPKHSSFTIAGAGSEAEEVVITPQERKLATLGGNNNQKQKGNQQN